MRKKLSCFLSFLGAEAHDEISLLLLGMANLIGISWVVISQLNCAPALFVPAVDVIWNW